MVIALTLVVSALLVCCLEAIGAAPVRATPRGGEPISAVGAENEYADVIAQIGGPYVHVAAVMRNPNTDPHAFETSPAVAQEVADAALVVQNGLGYDAFMGTIESGSPSAGRHVIDVQQLLGLPDATPNPHLWYQPATMPAVARAVAATLGGLDPAHRSYFEQKVKAFDASLLPWAAAIAGVKVHFKGTPVATTEPVADYLLRAMGLRDATPQSFEQDTMNGVDPAPEAVSAQESLLSGHGVKVFVYNRQVTDPLTQSLLSLARLHHIPVVGVYETMPPDFRYQSWMLSETMALENALAHGTSAATL